MTPRTLAEERYRVERRLGHGGMATVFLAHDHKLDRPVAIKLLADNLAGDPEVRARFTREARLAARLDHPNVVRVFDVGEEDDRPYIVMELVEGGTLADRLGRRRRALPLAEGLQLLRQMCGGLGHAHSRDLVHRDVKPQNLLIREADGCLKVADFGIARAAEETRLTRAGNVIGTDRYMAPEQVADEAISPATDVFACGVVADEVLPGRRTRALRQVVDRCLRTNPSDRFGDARALGRALAAVDENGALPVTAPPRRAPRRAEATTRRIGPPTLPTARRPPPSGDIATRRRFPDLRVGAAALALLAAAAVIVLVIVISSGGSGSSDGGGGAKAGGASRAAEPVPQLSDPADQARALADWLRAQGR